MIPHYIMIKSVRNKPIAIERLRISTTIISTQPSLPGTARASLVFDGSIDAELLPVLLPLRLECHFAKCEQLLSASDICTLGITTTLRLLLRQILQGQCLKRSSQYAALRDASYCNQKR